MTERRERTRRPRSGAHGALLAAVAVTALAACSGGTTGSASDAAGDPAATTTAPSGSAALVDAVCAGTATTAPAGTITSPEVTEASGIVASPDHAGIWWLHNDSGDTARFFGVRDDGTSVATFTLAGTTAADWEDIAVGAGDGTGPPTIYLADIGDNARQRSEIIVHRVAEPNPAQPGTAVMDDRPLHLHYPDGPHDAEALLVDPDSGDVVIVTKDWSLAGRSEVYRAAEAGTLDHVATVALPPATLVTGGDVSADGSVVALRSYDGVRLYPRPTGQPVWKAFDADPCTVAIAGEKQGEAVGFAPDGRSFTTVSEGPAPVLHRTSACQATGGLLDCPG